MRAPVPNFPVVTFGQFGHYISKMEVFRELSLGLGLTTRTLTTLLSQSASENANDTSPLDFTFNFTSSLNPTT